MQACDQKIFVSVKLASCFSYLDKYLFHFQDLVVKYDFLAIAVNSDVK